MKDALVTLFGGGGFLGRYVAQELLAQGARVRIAQRDPRRAWFLKPLGGLGQTQFVAVDVTRPETVARAAAGSDAVVNLVGTFTEFDAINVRGARAIAAAAAGAGAHSLVHISAIGADAASPARYARTKAEGEGVVREAFPAATILRPSVVFGREDQFINRFAGMIAAAPIVPVLKPEARFQPVYVHDVARAVVAAIADAGRHGGQTYELGGPDILSMADLYRWIGDQIGRTPPMPGLPDAAGAALASLGFLPGAPITKDQWLMLQRDNVVADGAKGLAALGVTPTPMGAVAPGWLVRFRRHGRFGRKTAV
ncbi:NAD-dependent epimerase/dehydratase family protein [Sphingomonas baiyangensis]|uniref:NAD-dependent epimerase/dehydratase family protein n=1 Tax=Sphingomonas baiyangensis TaxID=2572576 RepID=A0A4U1L0U1_9SPHN|nr:NAD-dependent epimerase/dehydratase family protein [Sphingomonas baiyangensis]TKD50381.1 NAD-dependent epimerase/dehydratase family protein [Sphingomonas baiyangensis]